MTDVTLTPEQTEFAQACVRDGHYPDIDAVIRAGLALLETQQSQRAALSGMLEAAVAEADRDGWIEWETMDTELDEIIRDAAAPR